MLPYYPRDGSVIPRAELDKVIADLDQEDNSDPDDDLMHED
jgi:hypothetical protein